MLSNTCYNEDCLTTLGRIEAFSIDLLLQDTPFGCTQNRWDIKPNLTKMWPEWLRVAKENAVFIFFATQPFASELISSNPKMFRYDIIWHKTTGSGHLNAKRMPLRNHEHILVFYKKAPTYNPQKTTGHTRKVSTAQHGRGSKKSSNYGAYNASSYDSTERYPTSVITCSTDKQRTSIHPTQKPLSLVSNLIRQYSNPFDWVYDGYNGSGTTQIASFLESRNFIGAEKDKEIYELSQIRYNKMCLELTT